MFRRYRSGQTIVSGFLSWSIVYSSIVAVAYQPVAKLSGTVPRAGDARAESSGYARR